MHHVYVAHCICLSPLAEMMCFVGHYALWQAGVYHRDVSPGNMMWYRNGTVLMGVLNDYDLSSLATALGPQGNERTGTIPFMALDLLSKKGQRGEVKHLYRHDLESFMSYSALMPSLQAGPQSLIGVRQYHS